MLAKLILGIGNKILEFYLKFNNIVYCSVVILNHVNVLKLVLQVQNVPYINAHVHVTSPLDNVIIVAAVIQIAQLIRYIQSIQGYIIKFLSRLKDLKAKTIAT